ncbi:NYN domain-containing protein [Paraneptunicella aestuarii]|uniref:NYN domain-containing protein n=1 Tax=Paraneptunicella aestuarii TaxID=2831148 RepID=UPI001E35696B|nr:NYN domain-containing protein [Paraneptunicella aestuarii]UAA40468.1 NYN domain-containing protein [Paraneptunicella aestuarii]
MDQVQRIAIFIDADNAPARKISKVLSELARHGVVNIRRAYGNWKGAKLQPWEDVLQEFAIQPIQQFDYTKGKNAADIALVIDVMDVLYTKNVDVVCLMSSDCDFTPLATRVVAEGKMVIGFGERKTPDAFVQSCSRFLFLDEEVENHNNVIKVPANKLKQDSKLMNLLRQAVEAEEEEAGWAKMGSVGQHISNHASFDQRNYGYKKLSDLFANIDVFELKKSNSSLLWVRNKRKNKQQPHS